MLLLLALALQYPVPRPSDLLKRAHTYSIVAYDSATGDLGIAVQSKFPNVGGIVPWAKAGVGAVATQALGNTDYGEEGLPLVAAGGGPSHAVQIVVRPHPRPPPLPHPVLHPHHPSPLSTADLPLHPPAHSAH